MKSLILTSLLIAASLSTGFAQVSYSGKVELGYLKFQNTTQESEWIVDYIKGDYNGLDVNLVNSIKFKENFTAGVGIGYLNILNKSGISIFSDFEYTPLKTKVSPLLNTKVGYSNIWNQYGDRTGTALVELGAGLKYKITERWGVYVQSGILLTQKSSLVPIKIGVQF
ncbi:hypothetical protein DXT99_25990 [Pontibacter diazotrophicus]|uniref:Outer membrane protein beta-barrel domain-containing protein n=1 Tax=Pontibacter diazotrophicus TaxID=1400979 RepID=A0A3D8KZU6_9BACT|nr:hypothetical protein [Pontibacter diazotrophicus]RDV10719.1 hypothetical protein DXT99_25990 [Pontibacter diazotrophicus]